MILIILPLLIFASVFLTICLYALGETIFMHKDGKDWNEKKTKFD